MAGLVATIDIEALKVKRDGRFEKRLMRCVVDERTCHSWLHAGSASPCHVTPITSTMYWHSLACSHPSVSKTIIALWIVLREDMHRNKCNWLPNHQEAVRLQGNWRPGLYSNNDDLGFPWHQTGSSSISEFSWGEMRGPWDRHQPQVPPLPPRRIIAAFFACSIWILATHRISW